MRSYLGNYTDADLQKKLDELSTRKLGNERVSNKSLRDFIGGSFDAPPDNEFVAFLREETE